MEKRVAAGAVVFRLQAGEVLFLLIFSGRNGAWGFPKGHIEPGEGERDAAVREITEETGLTGVRFAVGFREEDVYAAKSSREEDRGKRIEKHSIYYLAGTDCEVVTVDGKEITAFRWLGYKDARNLLTFESARQILDKANSFLDKGPVY